MTETRIYFVEYFEGQVKGRPETRRGISPIFGTNYNPRMAHKEAMKGFMNIFEGTPPGNIEIFSVGLKDKLTFKEQQQYI